MHNARRFSVPTPMSWSPERSLPYSALMSAALMIGHHFSISALWKACSASGVSCSGGKMSCESSISFLRIRIGERLHNGGKATFAICGATNRCPAYSSPSGRFRYFAERYLLSASRQSVQTQPMKVATSTG